MAIKNPHTLSTDHFLDEVWPTVLPCSDETAREVETCKERGGRQECEDGGGVYETLCVFVSRRIGEAIEDEFKRLFIL